MKAPVKHIRFKTIVNKGTKMKAIFTTLLVGILIFLSYQEGTKAVARPIYVTKKVVRKLPLIKVTQENINNALIWCDSTSLKHLEFRADGSNYKYVCNKW